MDGLETESVRKDGLTVFARFKRQEPDTVCQKIKKILIYHGSD